MASRRAQRRKECTAKIPHASEQSARAAMNGLVRRKGERGLHVYQCTFGAHYHVGHEPRHLKAARRSGVPGKAFL
jgi:hypothetical protein